LAEVTKFEDYDQYFLVFPFHVDEPVDADNLIENLRKASTDIDVQIVDLDRIAGRRHLHFAMLNALHTFKRGTNISRTLAVEFLLYTSAQKQISEAIRMVGVNRNTRNVAVIAVGGSEESIRSFSDKLPSLTNTRSDNALLDHWSQEKIENLISTFKISEKEIQAMSGKKTPRGEAIQRLIIERVALLPTRV